MSLTAPLRAVGGGRVWSLMISLFGDLAQEEGTAIDGPVLSAMMTLLEVRPEAARVALHRLRNDGWITSEKVGRISHHSLTEKGRAESAAATPRIYAAPPGPSEGWQLVVLKAADHHSPTAMAAYGFAALAPRLYVGPANTPPPPDTMTATGEIPPAWLREQLRDESVDNAYSELAQSLESLEEALPSSDTISPLQTAVLRGLIVHNWRRLILKFPVLPPELSDPDGPARRSHLRVAALLDRLPRPAVGDLAGQSAA
ncbi:Transcriptional repressor PaaX [Sulfitobacter sp. THAF37]|uniref:PaaX family transcriptional regulator C-terminal domain-containing protein n=1 Tax=Sulfitobacter sp. THAF37 TaxID=2587855 RepID=UPI0012A78698|nr:PaaX family transcriptional regulator C-terminal domain-containing protein [Sulfitobacter sp. THAF37]QFT58169.1 Transcriptional repressor PaaX [Sulfitobacter sp. THAF37]